MSRAWWHSEPRVADATVKALVGEGEVYGWEEPSALRFCPRCDAEISISEFGINRSRKDGLNRYCKAHIRKSVAAMRARNAGYRKTEWQRKIARERRQSTTAVEAVPSLSQIDVVFKYLEKKGEATQKEIQNDTKLSRAEVDAALTELFITRRRIGTRALTMNKRIWFCK